MKKYILFILVLLFSYGCKDKADNDVSVKPEVKKDTSLSIDMLKNAEYKGIYDTPVKLTEGKYEGEPFVKGGASRPTVRFIDSFTAFGDLNGDGIKDAVAVLAEDDGGSATSIYIATIINKDGKAVDIATQFLDDRAKVESIAINSEEVVLTLLIHAPKDPMCCPSLKEVKNYVLQNGALVSTKTFRKQTDIKDDKVFESNATSKEQKINK